MNRANARRSALIECACEPCRVAKTKCDGVRPECGKCRQRQRRCIYLASSGQTRHQAERASAKATRQRLERCEELIALLRSHSVANEDGETIDDLTLALGLPAAGSSRSTRSATSSVTTNLNSPESSQGPFVVSEEPDDDILNEDWDPLLQQPNFNFVTASTRDDPEASLTQLASLNGTTTSPISPGYHNTDSVTLPLHTPDQCLMSKVYLSFRDASRTMIERGTPAPLVLGDANTVDVTLLSRPRNPTDVMNVDNWACELLRGLRESYDTYLLLAWASLLTRFIRWVILPTASTYAQVPAMIRPLPSQRATPHNPTIDLCPHPAFREMLMRRYRNWIVPQTVENVSVWESTYEDAVTTNAQTGRLHLTRKFEDHVQNAMNWKFGDGILRAFPEAEQFGVEFQEG